MKKTISIILAVLMLLSVFSITAMAKNGPKPNQESGSACIYFRNYKDDVDDIILFSAGEIKNDAIKGATYDLEKNTLTLTDFDHPELALFLEDMGDDFKLNIVGECTIYNLDIRTDDYGANLNVTGNGTLVVNPDKQDESAVRFNGEGAELKLHIDDTVSVKFLSCSKAVVFEGSSNGNKDTVFTQGDKTVEVEGGKNIYDEPVIIDGAYVDRDNETKTGYRAHQVNDPYYQDGLYSVTISQSEGGGNIYHVEKYIISDKFGVWVKDESFEPQDLDETEFNNNYEIDTRQGDVPKTITYTDENGEEKTGYLVVSTIQGEEDKKFVIDIDFNKDPSDDIHRAKPIERTPTGYTIEMTWGGYEVNYTSFFGRGLSYVYDDVYDDFMKPTIETDEFEVYEDADGNRYVFDEDDNVYRISEDNKVTINGKEYYVLTMWQGVSKDNLILVTERNEDEFYTYEYPGEDYIYVAPKPATPDEAETTAAAATESEEAETTAAPENTTAAPENTTAVAEPTTEVQETTATPEQPTTDAQHQPTNEATQATTAAPKTKATEPTVKEVKKGSSEKQIDKFVTSLKTEKDPKGSKFGLLCARQKKATKKAVTVHWNKLNGAKKYIVYGSLCGTKKGQVPPYKKITKTAKTSYTRKGLKKGTYFKFLIVALDKKGKVIASSKTVHIATKGGKVGNDKTVKVTTNKVGLKLKGKKTFKLKAKEVPQSKKLKVKRHRKIKYESSNPKVAKVNGKGKITAKKKGKATIFVYAQNGLYKKVKVTVK